MQFKDDQSKIRWETVVKDNNSRPYGAGILSFANNFAELIEEEKFKNPSYNLADKLPKHIAQANESTGNITRCMKSAALQILIDVWLYGDELAECSEKQYLCSGLRF